MWANLKRLTVDGLTANLLLSICPLDVPEMANGSGAFL